MEKGVAFPESLELLLIERALGAQAAEKMQFGKLSAEELQPVVTGMLELSDWFNGLSDKPGPGYMQSRWHRAAYYLYFLPANVMKARTVISEAVANVLRTRGGDASRRRLRPGKRDAGGDGLHRARDGGQARSASRRWTLRLRRSLTGGGSSTGTRRRLSKRGGA